MTDSATLMEPIRAPRKKAHALVRLGRLTFGLFVALLLALASFLFYLDTESGHRFIVQKIAEQTPRSGLRIRIGAIEGSIWGETRLRDVRLYDPQGLFAHSPLINLDWEPIGWVANRLHINTATSRLVVLERLPKLRPAEKPGPVLPGFDIWIDRLRVEEVRIAKAVTGVERSGVFQGRADIREGRALIDLDAMIRDGGDRLSVLLDAEPDRNRFDLDVQLAAPANSLAGAIAGTKRPIRLSIEGDGNWTAWKGRARLNLTGQPSADLRLRAEKGRYTLNGALAPAQFLSGKLARLSAPRIAVQGVGTFADRRLDGRLSLRSAALKVETAGVIDLATSSFDTVRLGIDLLRPSALFPNMTGNRVRLAMTLDGAFGTATFAYRATAPRIAFDDTGFEDVRAEGRGQLGDPPVTVPVRFTARRVTGVGTVAGGILANLRVDGLLKVTDRALSGEGLNLTSDKLKGKVSLFVDLVTGRYDVVLSGGITRYFIPGLGIVDVTSELKVVPGPGGRGTMVTGTGKAWVRRLDNKFLLSLAGGLPRIETNLVRGPDGVLHFRNLRLRAPKIAVNGNGYRRRNGTFHFEGRGNQAQYGPFSMVLDGDISRPTVTLNLDRPNDALGVRSMQLTLQPNADGYAYQASGGSTLGPFTSEGAILLPSDGPATIQVAALRVSGTTATGSLRSDPGGFTGQLNLSGGGLGGALLFRPAGDVQRIEAHLVADQARFAGPPLLTIAKGRLDGVILLDPAGTSIEATLDARGVRRGAVTLANLSASASLRGGTGQVRVNVSGTRGRAFSFLSVADVAPGRIRISGKGSLDRRPIELTTPATLTHEGDGWRLAPTAVAFAGGSGTVSGLFNSSRTVFDARLDAMPLSALDIAFPDLGLGGLASGTVRYDVPADGSAPSGDMNLRVRGLTRAGVVLSSKPVDIGIAAKLDARGAALRAVAVSDGRTVGRAQARLSPLPQAGSLAQRLNAAPLFAQIRYSGPIDTLWGLTGVELFAFSGPAAIGADVTGTLNDPVIRGSLRTSQARLESAITGTIIQGLTASGRFDGSRLLVDSFSGTTKNDGRVKGRGSFLLSARGVGIDLTVDATRAQLLDRDDLKARVTGPFRIQSDGDGGLISGDLQLVDGLFRLGRATAAQQVPRLAVKEVNGRESWTTSGAQSPWRFEIDARARRGLQVTGLGISSEWSADLKIGGTVTAPALSGRADLIRGGYDFAGRAFDLERGTIRFTGNSPPDPILDIVAEGGVQGLNATINVTGTGLRPEITFTSTPSLPQDELLSRLLFGTSITNLSAPEALQLAAAVAALNNPGSGLDPINAVRSAVGLDRLRILPADIVTGQGTSLAAGKYLGRRFYVEVVTDGRGYSATRIEYQITRWLSLLSSVSTIGRHSASVRVSKDY